MTTALGTVGTLVGIRRYPVKSMLGETVEYTTIGGRGLLGDRAFALIDVETGKVASAKNPRRWPRLFGLRAAFVEPPEDGRPLPPVRITLPDGTALTSDQADVEDRLTAVVGRPVRLAHTTVPDAVAEGLDAEGGGVFEFQLPAGTFFDGALVHLVTTATLARLRSLAPDSRFDVPRFRPNFVIETPAGADGFVEDGWIGWTLALGEVRLHIDGPCPRCVMTTLAQGDLPKDPEVLRTAARHNGGNVGVYASVVRPGRVRRGDAVELV